MSGLALVALLGCGPPTTAESYAAANAAPTFEAGWEACARIVDIATRADCSQSVSARFERFDRCDQLPEGAWREECYFSAAEFMARRRDRVGAVGACQKTRYTRNCETHVLDGLAMEAHAGSLEDAQTALAPVRAVLDQAHVSHEFWYSFFRIRIDAGLPVETERCPDDFCVSGSRRAIMRVVDQDRKKAPDTPVPTYVWATTPGTQKAVATAWERPEDRRPAHRPPPPARTPVEPAAQTE